MTVIVHPPELRRLVIYSAVGALNTAICYVLFVAMVEWFAWHYHLALAADYAFGIVLGYALHRGSTFADRRHLRNAFGKYTITLVLTFGVNFALLDLLVRGELLGPVWGQAVAMTVASVASYLVQRQWVFRSHADQTAASTSVAAGASERRATEAARRAA